MKTNKLFNSFLLFIAAFIWGTTFVAQSVGMDYIEPFTFNGIRCIIGGFVLIPFAILSKVKKEKIDIKQSYTFTSLFKKHNRVIKGGIICGLCLFVATNLQQIGLVSTSAGKAGFITAFYIVIVPILGIFFKKKTNFITWIAVLIAIIGMYLLCVKGGFTINTGDFLIFICSIIFSIHIITIDHFSPSVNGIVMSCIQFLVCGVLSVFMMFLFENPNITNILKCTGPILYSGILSCGIAYTFQIMGQRNVNATVAALIMSLESVVSVLAGWVLLKEVLSAKELIGCLLMFIAIIFAQLPSKK